MGNFEETGSMIGRRNACVQHHWCFFSLLLMISCLIRSSAFSSLSFFIKKIFLLYRAQLYKENEKHEAGRSEDYGVAFSHKV